MERSYSETEVKRLIAEAIAPLQKRIAELESEVARLKKNSSNSSKPPSSDITKPPAAGGSGSGGGGARRHIGGQEGHDKHERCAFAPEQIDQTLRYELSDPGKLVPLNKWRTLQTIELVEKPFVITEHQARVYRDGATGTRYYAPFPPEVSRAGLCGPRLSAFIGYLKGACHMSYAVMQEMLADVMGVELSTGLLARIVQRASVSLTVAYEQLAAALPRQEVLGVDETGHCDRGKKLWTWCFRAQDFAVFRLDASRSSQVLLEMLGADYAGTLICDFFSAYRKFLRETPCAMQFCQAHLIRDIRFLETLAHGASVRWAGQLLQELRKLFVQHHQRLEHPEKDFSEVLENLRRKILSIIARAPASAQAQAIKERFVKFRREYFRFVESPRIAPTNNFTERTLRFTVIDRKLTQGTRGKPGQAWCQRIWSVLATCRLQGRSAFQFIAQSILCSFKRIPTPQLLPAGP